GSGGRGGMGLGMKIFADLLVEHGIGDGKFEFNSNHAYVIALVNVKDNLQFATHISDDPIYYELVWNIRPNLSLRAGKIFVPFGLNEFHHIIGGRVDELSSFLPETWTDHGLSLHHLAYDGDSLTVEYDLYVINGLAGTDGPVFGEGTGTDNNWEKGVGTRVKLDLPRNLSLVGNLYYDAWDAEGDHKIVFYGLGAELRRGFSKAPVLRRIGLRGEWARGEIQIPDSNYQSGIIDHAFARAGFYTEISSLLYEDVSFRFRTGLVNPDNTVTDEGDLWIYEPAVVYEAGKTTVLAAYQATKQTGETHKFKDPPDMIYAKLFLRY
ncbi:MAG: hypothetical protein JRF63_05955, partial [Deltaproteobacteria bacterium]|nr:hypothetical protein [Deltaproteobacteria bacterium]